MGIYVTWLGLVHNNRWGANTQIQDVMFVPPDRRFAWLFRIEPVGQVYPSSVINNGYYKCNLYIHDVSSYETVSACLQSFGIEEDNVSDFEVLNSIGELIDPTTAHIQTVVLKSKTGDWRERAGRRDGWWSFNEMECAWN